MVRGERPKSLQQNTEKRLNVSWQETIHSGTPWLEAAFPALILFGLKIPQAFICGPLNLTCMLV